MTIERILGTDTGKEAFYKADRNFVALEKRPILNKAAAYTVVADDLNKTITVTGETTITLTAIATLGLGFRCRISNIGTGIISIVPSGTDTIATGTGITIYPGKCVEVVADYAGMWTVVGFDFTEVVNSLGAQINSLVALKRTFHLSRLISKLQNGETVTIVFIGDSITDDYYIVNGHVNQLSTWLNVMFPGLVTVINAGVGGNNIKQMWDRLYTDVLINNPDLVIISSGTNDNDGDGAISTTLFRQYYDTLIKEILSTNDIDIILRNSTPLMNSSRNIALENFNKITEEIAKKYNLGFFDVYSKFQNAFDDGSIIQADINLDGTHLNEVGQTYITEWFKPFFIPTEFVERPSNLYKMLNGLNGFKVYNTGAVETTSPSTINGRFFYFNSPNNFVLTEFEGDEVTIIYTSGVVQGQFVAEIDGVAQTVVDTYSSSTIFRNFVTYKLTSGKHTLKIIDQATKNINSTSNLLHIQAIIYKNTQSFINKDIPIFTDFAWVYQSVEQSLTSGSPTLFTTNSRVDETKHVTIDKGTFTLNKSGIFDILFTTKVITDENADITIRLEVNGSINRKYVYDKTTSFVGVQTKTVDLHEILALNAGDYIKIYITVGGTSPKITSGLKFVKL